MLKKEKTKYIGKSSEANPSFRSFDQVLKKTGLSLKKFFSSNLEEIGSSHVCKDLFRIKSNGLKGIKSKRDEKREQV